MLEMLRKKLIDAGIDPAVGSIDYWGTQLEGVLLDMYDLGAASEREACAKLCEKYADVLDPLQPESVCADYFQGGVKSAARRNAQRIRARSEPSPAFKNYIDDNWAGIV